MRGRAGSSAYGRSSLASLCLLPVARGHTASTILKRKKRVNPGPIAWVAGSTALEALGQFGLDGAVIEGLVPGIQFFV
jgi:hypothetical protein